MSKVSGRTVGPYGKTIGTFHDTTIFNSIIYDVEFPDGEVKEYSANVIDENMLSQVDNEGLVFLNSNRMSRLFLKTTNMQLQSVEADV